MPEPPPNVSQIVADALNSAADGLSRWLGHPIDTEQFLTSPGANSENSELPEADDVMCCCAMDVELSLSPPDHLDIVTEAFPAGQLLLVWNSNDAAWLIDKALHQEGTSTDESKWGSLERSVIAETCNVVGCVFLNAIAESVRDLCESEVTLTPGPPHVTQQSLGSFVGDSVKFVESTIGPAPEFDGDIESNGNPSASDRQKVWLATGLFHVANQTVHKEIKTRMVMVWCPRVWERLNMLVDGTESGEEGE